MSARSMTGFAQARRSVEATDVLVSVKSVNHRGLDVHFRMPVELDPLENAMRGVVKRHVARGHLQIQVKFTAAGVLAQVVVNQALLESYLTTFRRTAAIHGLHGEPDLNAALRVPGMFEASEVEPDPRIEAAVLDALEEALQLLNEFREREGGEIAAEMRRRNRAVAEAAAAMEDIRTRALPAFQARLSSRLGELLGGAAVDPQRLAQEVAILADRSDVSEELTRLKVHSAQLDSLLNAGEEVGKKLDFLLQEMQRESNTILSKTSGIGELGLALTDLGLRAKAEIEKVREQSLNLE